MISYKTLVFHPANLVTPMFRHDDVIKNREAVPKKNLAKYCQINPKKTYKVSKRSDLKQKFAKKNNKTIIYMISV